jgi:GntR family transcriptional repressor for pyruvate dehydrogenase complex
MPATKRRKAPAGPTALQKSKAASNRTPGITPRRSNKVSDYVALDIVRDIVSRQLQPGDKLPPEPDLLRQYQVSRSTLREAMRVLEVQGLVHSRPGPGGGTVVGKVAVASLGRTLTLHMHLVGATYDELLASYVLAESITAELAAANPDRELVTQLMEPYVDGGKAAQHTHAVSEGIDFHQNVAVLANNRVLGFILQTPGAIVNDHIVSSLNRKVLEDHIIHDHSRIAAAIIAGNAKKAYLCMHEHAERLVEHFRAYWPARVGEKIEWR